MQTTQLCMLIHIQQIYFYLVRLKILLKFYLISPSFQTCIVQYILYRLYQKLDDTEHAQLPLPYVMHSELQPRARLLPSRAESSLDYRTVSVSILAYMSTNCYLGL